jgi:hypothetical protein
VTVVYDLLGYHVAVTAADVAMGRACQSVLASFAIDSPEAETAVQSYSVVRADDRWHVEAAGRRLHSATDPRAAIAALEWQLVTDALKHRADLFHVHGAALAPPSLDGAIVLAGAGGVGKTTLARALMERGFVPFGDDVTLVDPVSLSVQPFPRAFHLRESGGDTPDAADPDGLPTYFQPPRWARFPLPVKLILFLVRTAEREARVVPLGSADAASSLLGQSGTLAAAPAHALAIAVRLIAQAPCYRFELGSPEASAAVVEALCTGWRSRPLEARA